MPYFYVIPKLRYRNTILAMANILLLVMKIHHSTFENVTSYRNCINDI